MLLASDGEDIVFMRVLRLCKIAKALRALRALRVIVDLQIIVACLVSSLAAGFWSLVVMLFVLYVMALVLLNVISLHQATEENVSPQFSTDVALYFSSLDRSIVSLYMSVTGGLEYAFVYNIMQEVHPAYGMVFLLFTFFFSIMLFNVLTGLFVEKAVSAAAPRREDLVLVRRRRARTEAKEFCHLFRDLSGTKHRNSLSRNDFQRAMRHETMVSYMASIGLQVHDAATFFNTMSANTGQVTLHRFIEGCMQMKGNATGIDMQHQLAETLVIQQKLNSLAKDIRNIARHCGSSATTDS